MIKFNPITDETSYFSKRYKLVENVEENGVPKLIAYADSEGIPTIGVGMNLRTHYVAIINKILLNYPLTDLAKRPELEKAIETEVNKKYPKPTGNTQSAIDAEIRNNLNKVMAQYCGEGAIFSFSGELDANRNNKQIKEIFDGISGIYEDKIDDWIPELENEDSEERLVLFSLSYNTKDGLTTLLGNDLKKAIETGNRPEAWYEIRYQSNGNEASGIAKRRYYESQLFGLYDNFDSNSISEEEAKSVFEMYTKHRGKIKDYDYGYRHVPVYQYIDGKKTKVGERDMIEQANLDYNTNIVQTFEEATAKARQVLINKYAPEKDSEIDEILVDLEGNGINRETNKKTSNALILGSSKDDIIRTGKGSNIVYGDDGNDIISSSTGSNSNELHGESGTDTYNFETLSGNNIINDSDGNGKIQIGNIILSGNANPKTDSNGNVIDGVWSFDSVDLYKKGSDLVIVKVANNPESESVGKITIKNFPFENSRGAFGITLGKKADLNLGTDIFTKTLDLDNEQSFPYGGLKIKSSTNEFSSIVRSKESDSVVIFDEKANQVTSHSIYNTFKSNVDPSLVTPEINKIRVGQQSGYMINGKQYFIYSTEESRYIGSPMVLYSRIGALMLDEDGNIKETKIYWNSNSKLQSFEGGLHTRGFLKDSDNKLFHFYLSINNGYSHLQEIDRNNLAKIGDSITYSPKQWSAVRDNYQNSNTDSSDKRHFTLASGAEILFHPNLGSFTSSVPKFRDLTPAEIIPNYEISGNQDTNVNLKESVITVSRKDESNLRILPNPNSYTVIRGLNDNEKAKIDILDLASEAKIYSIDSSQYSSDDILAGKFKPSSNPLSLANYVTQNQNPTEWQRRLAENNSFNATDDYGSYYSDNSTNNDNSWQEFTTDGKYYSTLMALPNNQTVLLSGVNATELVNSPQNYFVSQEIVNEFPTSQPSTQPSDQPTIQPSLKPSKQPISNPTSQPTHHPTAGDLIMPTSQPTIQPSSQPSKKPSVQPSSQPSFQSSIEPTSQPSTQPTKQPLANPSYKPTAIPSFQSTSNPTSQPSVQPSSKPSESPDSVPSSKPSSQPSEKPISNPSVQPTSQPTHHPIAGDLEVPTSIPSGKPISHPSQSPSFKPQAIPSFKPTNEIEETKVPTIPPSNAEVLTNKPTNLRTNNPSNNPTSFPTFLETEGLTQAQTFNTTFNQSLPQPPQIPNRNSSFVERPEGVVTVASVALLAVGGLVWVFRKGENRVNPETSLNARQVTQLFGNEDEITRG